MTPETLFVGDWHILQHEPGRLFCTRPILKPERLSDWASRHFAEVPFTYGVRVNGALVPVADFPHIHLFPASDVVVEVRAEGARGGAQFGVTILALFAAAAGQPQLAAVILAVGTTAVNLLVPLPALKRPPRGPDDSENDLPTLSTGQNQARLGDVVPEVYGERVRLPDLIQAPYTQFTAGDVQQLFQSMAFGRGEYAWKEVRIGDLVVWKDGASTSDAVAVEFLDPGDTSTLFPHRVVRSQSIGRTELQWVDSSTWSGPFVIGQPGQRVDRIAIDLEFPAGLADTTGGGFVDHTVEFEFQYRRIDDDGDPVTPWMVLARPSVTRRTTFLVGDTTEVDVIAGRYEVRGQVSASQVYDSGALINRSFWTGLRGFVVDGAPVYDFSVVNIRIENTDRLAAQTAQKTLVRACRKLPEWNGSSWTAATETRKIAAAVSHWMRDENTGDYPDTAFDIAGLWTLQTTWTSAGHNFDGIIDTRDSWIEGLRRILRVGRSDANLIGGFWTFYRDEARTETPYVFNVANIVRDSFSLKSSLIVPGDFSHVVVEYPDADADFQTLSVDCSATGSYPSLGDADYNPQIVRMGDITSRQHAWEEGMHLDAARRYRVEIGEWRCELTGRLLTRGSVVEVSHPLGSEWGLSGAVLGYSGGVLELSEDYGWPGGTHQITLRDPEGLAWGPLTVTEGSPPNLAVPDSAALTALEASSGQDLADIVGLDGGDLAPFTIGAGSNVARRMLIKSVRPDGDFRYRVEAVIDATEVYSVTSGKSPPAAAELLPVPGTPAAAPDITWINLVITGANEITAEAVIPAGATSYEFRIDGGTAVATTEPRHTFTSVSSGSHTVEARAFGTSWGAWHGQTITTSGSVAAPGAAGSYAAKVGTDDTAPGVDWTAATDATQYRLRLLLAAVEKALVHEVQALEYDFSSADVIAAGGPWEGITVGLLPRNTIGDASSEQFVLFGQPGPVTGITQTGATTSSVTATCDTAVEETLGYATITGYKLVYGASPGFDPESPDGSATDATTTVTLTGMPTAGQIYYCRMAAYITTSADLNWSNEFTLETDATP